MIVRTESGSVYDINPDGIQRVGDKRMRKDGEVRRGRLRTPVVVGNIMVIEYERGQISDEDFVTYRMTTPVVSIMDNEGNPL